LLAATGTASVLVITVAGGVLSTGDEIVEARANAAEGQYSSQTARAVGVAGQFGHSGVDLGHGRRRARGLRRQRLDAAQGEVDRSLTSGGASRATRPRVRLLQKPEHWICGVSRSKPGRPLALGNVAGHACFWLAVVTPWPQWSCTLIFARPRCAVAGRTGLCHKALDGWSQISGQTQETGADASICARGCATRRYRCLPLKGSGRSQRAVLGEGLDS